MSLRTWLIELLGGYAEAPQSAPRRSNDRVLTAPATIGNELEDKRSSVSSNPDLLNTITLSTDHNKIYLVSPTGGLTSFLLAGNGVDLVFEAGELKVSGDDGLSTGSGSLSKPKLADLPFGNNNHYDLSFHRPSGNLIIGGSKAVDGPVISTTNSPPANCTLFLYPIENRAINIRKGTAGLELREA